MYIIGYKSAKARPLSSSFKNRQKRNLVSSLTVNELGRTFLKSGHLKVVLKIGWLKKAFCSPVFMRVPEGRPRNYPTTYCGLRRFWTSTPASASNPKLSHDILWIKTYSGKYTLDVKHARNYPTTYCGLRRHPRQTK